MMQNDQGFCVFVRLVICDIQGAKYYKQGE
jgi:hypothetical protein